MSTNVILAVAEAALQTAIVNAITTASISPVPPIYVSDEQADKVVMPYIIIHIESADEQEGPGTGLYKVPVAVTLRSHVKPDSTASRQAIIQAINNFVYSDPMTILSLTDGFHCYGFMPIEVKMEVNTDLKAYEYINRFTLICMPRNNT